jgi:hypothetical protein
MTCKDWSPEEIETLRQIMSSGMSLKKNMHLLPGRSYGSAGQQCTKYGIKHASVETRVLRVMADGKTRLATKLAAEIGASRTSVSDVLHDLSMPGDEQRVHVCGFTEGGRPHLIYVIGRGVNEQTRAPARKKPIEIDDEAELDRLYRSNAAWWPHADPVVIASINAMVHAGRAAA